MKLSYLTSIVYSILFFLLIMTSCSKIEKPDIPFTCNEEALFSKECVTGTMFYLSCYDSWSIKLDETNTEGDHLYAASPEIPESYKVDNKEVKLYACFYQFDLELLFPDPTFFGEMYVIRDYNLSTNL